MAQRDLDRRAAAYRDRFFDDADRLVAIAAVLAISPVAAIVNPDCIACCVERRDDQVFLIDRIADRSPCKSIVVTGGETRQERVDCANRIQSGGVEVREVTRRRQCMNTTIGQVDCQQWLGRGRSARCNHDSASELGIAADVRRLDRDDSQRRRSGSYERDVTRREPILRQRFITRVAQVGAIRNRRDLHRLERSPDRIGLQSADATNLRATHFAAQVSPSAVCADPQQIVGRP